MDNPVRVLQVVSAMVRGGTETLLMNLYRNIDRTKIQFDFLVHTQEEKCFDKEIETLGGKIYRIPRYSFWRFDKQLKEYDKFFKEHPEYKIVHSHINVNNLGIIRSAYKAGVPTRICHLHSPNKKEKKIPLSYHCKRIFFPLISFFLTHRFACSKLVAKEVYGGRRTDVIILKNGIKTENYQFCLSDRIEKRNKLGWTDKFIVVCVARLVPPKNHSFLIDVFNEILKLRKDVVLVLVGSGSMQEQIQTKVKKLEIEHYVQFLGSRDDVPDLLKASDIFLLTSLYEGFGIVVEEAQATGLPVVASDVLPKETQTTDLIRYVSLSESPQRWAQVVLEEAEKERADRSTYAQVVKEKGFDISESARILSDFYLSEYQKNNPQCGNI